VNGSSEASCLKQFTTTSSASGGQREFLSRGIQPRSPRKRKARATAGAQYGVEKKRALTDKSQEYEFRRLAGARRSLDGYIECKAMWEPTWIRVEDLRGDRAVKEAEKVITRKFGKAVWETEARRSGYCDDLSNRSVGDGVL